MSKWLDIFMSPRNVFTSLKEKPKWLTPFVIVLIIFAITSAITVSMTRDTLMAKQEETLRTRGLPDAQIEQAMKFFQGPLPIIFGAIGAAIAYVIIMIVFALILNLFIPVFGGSALYKSVFSVICFSSMIMVPASIFKVILIAVTKSPYVSTSFALFVPNLAKTSFLYQFTAALDFFMIWELILVSLGISITNELEQKRSYILVFALWLISIFIGIGLGGIFGPRA